MAAGKLVPEDPQRTFLKAKIKPGSILFLPCNFITNPHPKYMVVLHVDYSQDLLLIFLVNSEIHPLIAKDPDLNARQILLLKTDYPFFDHNSYMDCTEVFGEVDIEKAVTYLLKRPDDYKGHLRENEILGLLQAVNSAATISDYDRELIMASLGN